MTNCAADRLPITKRTKKAIAPIGTCSENGGGRDNDQWRRWSTTGNSRNHMMPEKARYLKLFVINRTPPVVGNWKVFSLYHSHSFSSSFSLSLSLSLSLLLSVSCETTRHRLGFDDVHVDLRGRDVRVFWGSPRNRSAPTNVRRKRRAVGLVLAHIRHGNISNAAPPAVNFQKHPWLSCVTQFDIRVSSRHSASPAAVHRGDVAYRRSFWNVRTAC